MKQGRRASLAALGGAVLALAGCASQNLDEYATQKPQLDLASYFNGPVQAHGMFQDRSGQVVKRFVVQMDCEWNGDQGVLDERFTYSDGSTETTTEPAAAGGTSATASASSTSSSSDSVASRLMALLQTLGGGDGSGMSFLKTAMTGRMVDVRA